MSYILDALQRADAERARGSVPTLNARPLSNPAATPRLATPQRVGMAIAGLMVLLLAATLAWWIWGAAAQQPGVMVSAATVAPAVPQAVAPAVVLTVPTPPAPVAAAATAPPPAVRQPAVPAAVPVTQPKSAVTEKTAITPPAETKPTFTGSSAT